MAPIKIKFGRTRNLFSIPGLGESLFFVRERPYQFGAHTTSYAMTSIVFFLGEKSCLGLNITTYLSLFLQCLCT